MASAKLKLKYYFEAHVGEDIDRATLKHVAGDIFDWQRALRQMRQETGYDIVPTKIGYIMKSEKPKYPPKLRKNVNLAMRAMVLKRDNYRCQHCGRTAKDGAKLVVDHIIPVNMGGETTISNLQTLCQDCNAGKKDHYRDKTKVTLKQHVWGIIRFIKRLVRNIIVITLILAGLYYLNINFIRVIDPMLVNQVLDNIVSFVIK